MIIAVPRCDNGGQHCLATSISYMEARHFSLHWLLSSKGTEKKSKTVLNRMVNGSRVTPRYGNALRYVAWISKACFEPRICLEQLLHEGY
jgi:hypothetical protein